MTINKSKALQSNETAAVSMTTNNEATENIGTQKRKVDNVIPREINEAIDALGLSRIMKGKAIKLVCLIIKKSMYKNQDFTSYILLSSHYLEKTFNKEYHTDFFNKMKAAGIIECNGVCKQRKGRQPGIPYGYRLNQAMMHSEHIPVVYYDKKNDEEDQTEINLFGEEMIAIRRDESFIKNENQAPICEKPSNFSPVISSISSCDSISLPTSSSLSTVTNCSYHISPRLFNKSLIIDDLKSLVYDEEKIGKANKRHSNTIRKRLKVDDEVERNYFEVSNTVHNLKYEISKKSALVWAKENNVNVIQDGDHFYLKKLSKYIKDKKKSILFACEWQMAKLKNDIFYAGRNKVNKRLDHNLTCAGKHIINVIKKSNNLIEIDIKNSQFAIHAYWMKEKKLCTHEDTQRYYQMCTDGILYENIASALEITRSAAKQLMMEVGFSSAKNNTSAKAKFRKNFPNVVAHIDGFKKENGYKMFSNELQQLEAEIFVDNLYPAIKDLGIFCLTKHDSIIIKRKDREKVLELMRSYFNYLGFECVLDIEGEKVKVKNVAEVKTTNGGVLDTQNLAETAIEYICIPANAQALNEPQNKPVPVLYQDSNDGGQINQDKITNTSPIEKQEMRKRFTVDGLLNPKQREIPTVIKPYGENQSINPQLEEDITIKSQHNGVLDTQNQDQTEIEIQRQEEPLTEEERRYMQDLEERMQKRKRWDEEQEMFRQYYLNKDNRRRVWYL